MATTPLPERPNLAQLRRRARELQRDVRTGRPDALGRAGRTTADPEYRLTAAQLVIARGYGFASWARLRRHVAQIEARTWSYSPADDRAEAPDAAGEPLPNRLLRLACLSYADDPVTDPAQAAALLAAHPGLPSTDLAVAAVCGDRGAVQQHLRTGVPVDAAAGPFGWPPLMYVAYSRLERGCADVVDTVRLLLDAGADPNEGRYFQGYPTPFTVLTGVFGDGEGAQPAHPCMRPLARLLLEAGADPNDGQTLYNRQFSTDDDFLDLLFEFGLGQGDGGPWRHRLPDLTPAPRQLVRGLLEWAVTHDQRPRVARLAARGVDIVSPFVDRATPIAVAIGNGHRQLADQLRALGAVDATDHPPGDPGEADALNAVEAFVAAALAADEPAVRAMAPQVALAARAARPGLLAWAAALGRPATIGVLVRAGFDVDALGRGDVPREQPWQTALHTAVEHDDPETIRELLAAGADREVLDARFHNTPLQWADHFDRPHLAALLDPARGGHNGVAPR